MAEITKVTTPLVPRENLGNRNKPISDQAFELTDPNKVHRAGQDQSKIMDHQRDGQAALRDSIAKDMYAPLLKSTTDLLHAFQKITVLLQMGISTSEIANNAEIREMLESMYLQPDQLTQALKEQDGTSVLFKGAAFDVLRDIMAKFSDNPRVKEAVTQLIKTFEQNVNAENSVKTILLTCNNLLDYMFSGDRAQFSQYLQGLTEMLLPEVPPDATEQAPNAAVAQQAQETGETAPKDTAAQATAQQGEAAKISEGAVPLDEEAAVNQPIQHQRAVGEEKIPAGEQAPRTLGVEQREAAQILKGNLLPLLGEIVVKYNQNGRIRDMVMVVVHNIVRVDQGTPEALHEAIGKLVAELRLVANLPENFQQQLNDAVSAAKNQVKTAQNGTMEKLASIISETLSSPTANAATIRQAETLLLSLLQNQNSVMNVLHFMLPMETKDGKLFAEVYVDPDSDKKVGRSQEKSRKIFLAFESDTLGAFELSFLETGERVDFAMWCPETFVPSLGSIKRQISNIMQVHGYTMNSYNVAELITPHSVADVFPHLLQRRMGVDVRI